MMLETLCFYHPEAATTIRSFEYRAVNPMVVNKVITINGAWVGSKDSGPNRTAKLWVVNEDGYVGMTGTVELAPKPFQ
jgi:hydroxyacyl-ACP dehydratase HTD2-like protein with hotdog domain